MTVPSAVRVPLLLPASMGACAPNSSAAPAAVAAMPGSDVERAIVDNNGTRYDEIFTALYCKS